MDCRDCEHLEGLYQDFDGIYRAKCPRATINSDKSTLGWQITFASQCSAFKFNMAARIEQKGW